MLYNNNITADISMSKEWKIEKDLEETVVAQ
jgi:hypothetical protein